MHLGVLLPLAVAYTELPYAEGVRLTVGEGFGSAFADPASWERPPRALARNARNPKASPPRSPPKEDVDETPLRGPLGKPGRRKARVRPRRSWAQGSASRLSSGPGGRTNGSVRKSAASGSPKGTAPNASLRGAAKVPPPPPLHEATSVGVDFSGTWVRTGGDDEELWKEIGVPWTLRQLQGMAQYEMIVILKQGVETFHLNVELSLAYFSSFMCTTFKATLIFGAAPMVLKSCDGGDFLGSCQWESGAKTAILVDVASSIYRIPRARITLSSGQLHIKLARAMLDFHKVAGALGHVANPQAG